MTLAPQPLKRIGSNTRTLGLIKTMRCNGDVAQPDRTSFLIFNPVLQLMHQEKHELTCGQYCELLFATRIENEDNFRYAF